MSNKVIITNEKAIRLVTYMTRRAYPSMSLSICMNSDESSPDGLTQFRQVDVKSSSGFSTMATFAVFEFQGKGYVTVSNHNGAYDRFSDLETAVFI